MQDYHDLEIWRRGMDYAVRVYEWSTQLPQAERYNLNAQLRRSVVSVPLNIAEGAGCSTNKEFIRFLGYAYRSLKEAVTCLELSLRLYTSARPDLIAALIDEGNQISRMTYALRKRL